MRGQLDQPTAEDQHRCQKERAQSTGVNETEVQCLRPDIGKPVRVEAREVAEAADRSTATAASPGGLSVDFGWPGNHRQSVVRRG